MFPREGPNIPANGAVGFYIQVGEATGEEYYLDLTGRYWGVEVNRKNMFDYGATHDVPRVLI